MVSSAAPRGVIEDEVIATPYRIVYRVRADVLEIIAVVHSARQFPVDELRALQSAPRARRCRTTRCR